MRRDVAVLVSAVVWAAVPLMSVAAVVSVPAYAFGQLSGTNTPVPDRTQQREIEATRARADAAQLRLQAARAAVRAKFEADEEFTATNRELTEASRAFDEARKPVLERVRGSAGPTSTARRRTRRVRRPTAWRRPARRRSRPTPPPAPPPRR